MYMYMNSNICQLKFFTIKICSIAIKIMDMYNPFLPYDIPLFPLNYSKAKQWFEIANSEAMPSLSNVFHEMMFASSLQKRSIVFL